MTKYYIYTTFYSTVEANTEQEAKDKLVDIIRNIEEFNSYEEMNVLTTVEEEDQ